MLPFVGNQADCVNENVSLSVPNDGRVSNKPD